MLHGFVDVESFQCELYIFDVDFQSVKNSPLLCYSWMRYAVLSVACLLLIIGYSLNLFGLNDWMIAFVVLIIIFPSGQAATLLYLLLLP